MVRELYANWNEHRFMSWVIGKEMPLQKFVRCPTYTVIRQTLCGVNSNAKWTRTMDDTHNEMIRFEINKTAKVWQNFLQARLMPVEYNRKGT